MTDSDATPKVLDLPRRAPGQLDLISSAEDAGPAGSTQLIGEAALIASVGGQRAFADWTNPGHRLRRLLAEFLGVAGLTFILSGCAAVLVRYGGHALQPWQAVLVHAAVAALWLVVAVYFLGDISAHFNPAVTLAFALRRDMGWVMAGCYWIVQFAAAASGSLLARAFFGPAGNLAATMPQPGRSWQAAGFEVIITFGLVLMALNLADGPKLNGPFVPLAVGAYTMAWVTMGGLFDGASMNPARSFGPDVALGHLSTWWVYLIGPAAGAVLAVGVAHVLRGPATAQEAAKAMGFPWSGADRDRHVRPPLASSWPNTPHRTRPDRPRTGWTIPSTTSTSHPGSANQPRRQDRAVGSVLVCALPAVYPAANATEAN